MCHRNNLVRTQFLVRRGTSGLTETIVGKRHAWRFRLHFHAGDEIVHILAGRARLCLPDGYREVIAGDMLVVPAGVIHRFEPMDSRGWAFRSRFVDASTPRNLAWTGTTLAARAATQLADRPSLRTDIAALALKYGISPDHLARTFRRSTGSGLHNFHVLLALHRAKALLRQHVLIVEAALAAGFCDQAHLNREFVRTYGMTPAAFRDGWTAVA